MGNRSLVHLKEAKVFMCAVVARNGINHFIFTDHGVHTVGTTVVVVWHKTPFSRDIARPNIYLYYEPVSSAASMTYHYYHRRTLVVDVPQSPV